MLLLWDERQVYDFKSPGISPIRNQRLIRKEVLMSDSK